MPIIPEIEQKKKPTIQFKVCARCGNEYPSDNFAFTHSIFYPDHLLPICNNCIGQYLKAHSYEWVYIDKVCQWADIPWIVKEWDRICALSTEAQAWPVYAKVFASQDYENLGWADYNQQYVKLRQTGLIDEEIPGMHEEKIKALKKKWGANYDEDALYYLEDLYTGLEQSQNINGALQIDQAQKICKLSLEIDVRIRSGDKDVDKFLSSYDKLVKAAEFTPKSVKSAVDFDSFAEVGMWLEKRGLQNKFYDGVTRDVIDETLKNIQNYNRKLYINEGGIGDEITERIQSLQKYDESEESLYDIQKEFDEDGYDNEGYVVDNEEFSTDYEESGV